MENLYTLPKYPTYTGNRTLDDAVSGLYKREFTIEQLHKLAQNFPDDVKRGIARITAGTVGEALHCIRVAQQRAQQLVDEAFSEQDEVVSLQGNVVRRAEPLERDKALKLLMDANAAFVKQSEATKRLDMQDIVMESVKDVVRQALNDEQWLEFQVNLDRRVTEAMKRLVG